MPRVAFGLVMAQWPWGLLTHIVRIDFLGTEGSWMDKAAKYQH